MKRILTLALLCVTSIINYAQPVKPQAKVTAIKYQSINPDPFANMPVTQLGLDYYFVEQWSKDDRLWYEIVVIGDKLVVHLHASGKAYVNKTDYEYDGKITEATIAQLKAGYKKAVLVQKIKGVPVTNDDHTVKEILITKSSDVLIGGGWYYRTLLINGRSIESSIQADKQTTSSLMGNPELLIAEIKKLVPGLDGLLTKAYKSTKHR